MSKIFSKAPLRIGFAGGGTDISPYCDIYNGCVVNATIDLYAYATIESCCSSTVEFISIDQEKKVIKSINDSFDQDGRLNLHVATYRAIINNYNDGVFVPLKLTTHCDVPASSGLGSSSALVVAMIKSFSEFFKLSLNNHAIAQLAFKIERHDCNYPGGRQDQYSATFGGFNFMEFYANNKVTISPIIMEKRFSCELESSLILFNSKVSRDSSKIIQDQSNNFRNNASVFINAMHNLKQEAINMKESLVDKNISSVVESMSKGWINKKETSNKICPTSINDIYHAAILSGALSGKVSGAGGGGFIIFFTSQHKRTSVIDTLNCFEGSVTDFHFVNHGVHSWALK